MWWKNLIHECNAYNNLSMRSWKIVRATWKLRPILFQDSRPEHHNTPIYCTFQLRIMITPLGDNFAFSQLHPHSLSQSNRVIFETVGWVPCTEIFFLGTAFLDNTCKNDSLLRYIKNSFCKYFPIILLMVNALHNTKHMSFLSM